METKITKNGGDTTIVVYGRLDTTNASEFELAIHPLFDEINPNITIDCTNLNYISSSGLRIFMSLQKCVIKNNGKLILKSLNTEIKDIFDMTGFSNIFTII